MVGSKAPAFSEEERRAVYRAIDERRDVRRGYLPEPLPVDVLERLLTAAHRSPSVGLMQPTRLIVIRNRSIRLAIHDVFVQANAGARSTYEGERGQDYAALKLEGLLEAPQHLCVLCETGSARGHMLGRLTMPETAIYSTVCAVQNLWLAARAEGIGVGWVSILDIPALRRILDVPESLTPVAYLCLGYVDRFAEQPDLQKSGWETSLPLQQVVSYERYKETVMKPVPGEYKP